MSFSAILHTSGPETTSGNTLTVQFVPGIRGVLIMINVSAHSGSNPTLDFTLQCLDPGTNTFIDLTGIGAQVTGNDAQQAIIYPNANSAIYQAVPANWRIKWVLGGTTPSFTFSIGINYLS